MLSRAWEERTRGPHSGESNFNSLHTFETALEVDHGLAFVRLRLLISADRLSSIVPIHFEEGQGKASRRTELEAHAVSRTVLNRELGERLRKLMCDAKNIKINRD